MIQFIMTMLCLALELREIKKLSFNPYKFHKFVIIKISKMAEKFTSSNFNEVVLQSDKPVLVDFWAEWCGPCRMIGPMVDELSNEYAGKAVIGKLNVDENPDISMNYGVRSIPTLLIFKNGQLVDKIVGAVPKQNIASKIDAQL
jgi:thioredoxin 1